MERLAQHLKNMGEAAKNAQQSQESSKRVQELARRMAEQATPEQKEQFQKLMQEMSKVRKPGMGSGPGGQASTAKPQKPATLRDAGTQPVDARKQPSAKPTERVLAEYYSDRPYDRKPGESAAAPMSEEFKKAADAAERGSEQQAIPARYSDLVKRVFKRYAEQTAPPPEPKK
jgi:hypothetical protein